MTLVYAALLGVVQGLTEFLPVSSSAHLILTRAYFGLDLQEFGLAFDVACHLGTLLAVLVYFRRDLAEMLLAVPSVFSRVDTPGVHMVRLITVGTVPIALVGLSVAPYVESTLRTPGVAAAMLGLGGVALLAVERVGSRERVEDSLTIPEALALGVAQAAALVPGVSRSGAVIGVALLLGLRRDAAARFSFLLGVPAILTAAAKTVPEMRPSAFDGEILAVFVVGVLTSAVVGHLTVRYLLRYLAGHTLDPFAVYRIALAVSVPIWAVA